MIINRFEDASEITYTHQRIAHWDSAASQSDNRIDGGASYRRRLIEIYRLLIPRGQRILEIGCGQGDLLAALQPAEGIGIDFSQQMLTRARQRHPELTFIQADAHDIAVECPFDTIILSDLVNDLWDVQGVLQKIQPLCSTSTRLIINYYSRLWELPLNLMRSLKMATPNLYQNWLTPDDINNLLGLAGFEPLRSWDEVLLPLSIPVVEPFCNRFLAHLPLFRQLDLTHFTMARLQPVRPADAEPVVSVIVPARNEAGNIQAIFDRVPEMGGGTELIFVEGNSNDNTYQTIEETIKANPLRRVQLYRQTGKGKGDAVRLGYEKASGEVLMILDADLTVPPEDLPRFYDALRSGKGEMINGVRLVYPMEKEAMRFFNFLGNKFFSLVFSWLLGQPIKDTLCGTKVLTKTNYLRLAANRSYFGDFDPFGDFDLLFGAAHMNLKIVDVPIRYRERTYGSTNIERWKHGLLLLRMVAFAATRLKFI